MNRIQVGTGEAVVEPQQVVQVRCAAAPVPQYKERRRDRYVFPPVAVPVFFAPPKGRIQEGGERDGRCARQVRRIDRKPVFAQQVKPVTQRNPGQNARPAKDQEPFSPGGHHIANDEIGATGASASRVGFSKLTAMRASIDQKGESRKETEES